MNGAEIGRRRFLQAVMASGAAGLAGSVFAGDEDTLREPVHRVAKSNSLPAASVVPSKHPLDPALDIARDALKNIEQNISDYTCRITKQERIRGELQPQEFMEAKVRNRKIQDGKLVQPLSAYLKFLKPDSAAGREVVWVEGKNKGKLRAHEGGAA